MNRKTVTPAYAKKLFASKRAFHKEQAALPFEEKVKQLAALQKIAYNMAIAAGRKPKHKPWTI
ncbi:MAG: hypothetical protein QME74_01170 [Candidatus Edwardsbacteria bacterium]|nr:hypothetical protein [Candidatus Edwardsbacteria bacterium]